MRCGFSVEIHGTSGSDVPTRGLENIAEREAGLGVQRADLRALWNVFASSFAASCLRVRNGSGRALSGWATPCRMNA